MLVIYQTTAKLKELYTSFSKDALSNNRAVIILHHYDNAENIRQYLSEIEYNINRYEKEGLVLILDSSKPFHFHKQEDVLSFEKAIVKRSCEDKGNGTLMIADMGRFFSNQKHIENKKHLLSFENSLPKEFTTDIKRLCLYHKEDFKLLSSKEREVLYKSHLQCFILDDDNSI